MPVDLTRLQPALRWITRHGWVPLLALALAVGGVWAFLEIADDVSDGETRTFDESIFDLIARDAYGAVGEFWHQAGADITALGGSAIITLLALGAFAFLAMRRQWRNALLMVVAVVGGLAISLLLKEVYDRPRPQIVGRTFVMTTSFPSGHSSNSAVAYLTLAILLAKSLQGWRLKAYVIFVGLLLPFLVGLSRVFLGVHWPTDVIAGWLLGLAWGLLVYAVATLLQRKGVIEPGKSLNADAEAEA